MKRRRKGEREGGREGEEVDAKKERHERTNLVGSSLELVSRDLGDLSGDLHVESNLGVQSLQSFERQTKKRKRSDSARSDRAHNLSSQPNLPADFHLPSTRLQPFFITLSLSRKDSITHSSNSSSTLSKQAQSRDDILDSRDSVGELLHVTRELLSESKRSSVLEMGSTDLDDVLEGLSLDLHGVSELVKSREELSVELGDGGDVHGGGEAGKRTEGMRVSLRARVNNEGKRVG